MNDIYPPKPPIELPLFSQSIIGWLIGLFLFLLILFLLFIFLYLKKKNKKKEEGNDKEKKAKELQIDYYKISQDKLREIKKYIIKEQYKIFQLEVSKLIRFYLSGIYKTNFVDMTSGEILQNKNIDSGVRQDLQEFLSISDQEKFASQLQKKEQAEKAYYLAEKIINKNKKK